MVLQVGQELLQLEEEALAWLVAVWVHVDSEDPSLPPLFRGGESS